MAKMIEYHAPIAVPAGHPLKQSESRFLMIVDIHRIEVVPESAPVYGDGARAIIVCKGKPGAEYATVESAHALVAQIEGAP